MQTKGEGAIPGAKRVGRRPVKPEDRFNRSFVPVTETGCWLWTLAGDPDGYGKIWVNGKNQRAHRFAWEMANGAIPEGMHVCHKCDVPACVNPAHLFLGTIADNNADRGAKGRSSRRLGEANPVAKLTDSSVVAIREMVGKGARHKDIAAEFGVSRQAVGRASSGESWAHLPQGLKRAIYTLHHSGPMTEAEMSEYNTLRAREMARAEARRNPSPQLELGEAA